MRRTDVGIILVLVIAGAIIGVMRLADRRPSSGEAPVPVPDAPAAQISSSLWPKSTAPAVASLTATPIAATNRSGSLMDQYTTLVNFTPGQLAEYLQRNGTNAETLLAASDLGSDRVEWLKRAAALFPNDPRVQFAVVAQNVFPEARREWLDRLKAAAPDNGLAGYLSAREYLAAGDRATALAEMRSAAAKPHFDDYTLDRWQNAEEAQLQAGRPITEAKASSAANVLLPHLTMLKSMSNDMEAWARDYIAAGDPASAASLAQVADALSRQLIDGEGSRNLISQLVGVAIEKKLLGQLPPDSQPDFLGRPVQERLAELNAFRESVRAAARESQYIFDRGDDAEIISYFDRMKVQGELATLQWAQRKRSGTP